jgi:hypothetical protein
MVSLTSGLSPRNKRRYSISSMSLEQIESGRENVQIVNSLVIICRRWWPDIHVRQDRIDIYLFARKESVYNLLSM